MAGRGTSPGEGGSKPSLLVRVSVCVQVHNGNEIIQPDAFSPNLNAINPNLTAEDEFLYACNLMTFSRLCNILHLLQEHAFAERAVKRVMDWLSYLHCSCERYKEHMHQEVGSHDVSDDMNEAIGPHDMSDDSDSSTRCSRTSGGKE